MNKNLLILVFIAAVFSLVSCSQKDNNSFESAVDSITNKQNATKMELFLENESKFAFDATVDSLKAGVERKTWGLTAVHDLQETLKKKGHEVLPVKVFAICHPKHSSKILSLDDERIVSPLMPCRVSVYEKSDGKTYISRMNPEAMAGMFSENIAQVMKESAAEVEEILNEVVK